MVRFWKVGWVGCEGGAKILYTDLHCSTVPGRGLVLARAKERLLTRVIDPVPLDLDAGDLLRAAGAGMLREGVVAALMERCLRLIEPKAVFALVKVTGVEGDEVRLEGGRTLRSMVLADMLECGQVIAPYVVTIGPKLESLGPEEARGNGLRRWILEKVGDYALERASAHLRNRMEDALGGPLSSFSPGGGTSTLFGIEQQETLFHILNPSESVGVRLTPGYVMVPRKSVSGVLAATRREEVVCQYCPSERCGSRNKPFSGLYYDLGCEDRVH